MLDHFSLFAPVYDRLIGPPSVTRLHRILDMAPYDRLLDIGGGTGRVSRQLNSCSSRLIVTDLSRAMLKQAGRRGISATVAKAEQLPFADAAFDRIIVVDALHHFFDQSAAIAEMARLLRPGGRLVIEEPDIRRFVIKGVAVAEKLALMQSHFLTPETICKLMERVDLRAEVRETDPLRAWITGDRRS